MNRLRSYLLAGVVGAAAAGTLLIPRIAAAQAAPRRGDANSDRSIDISDALYLLTYIFNGGPAPRCTPAANANADSRLDISDAITILSYLFSGGVTLKPLTEEEVKECTGQPEVTVLRHGTIVDVLDPGHGLYGKVEELSDGTVRITHFYYDGTGLPEVIFRLTQKTVFDLDGVRISPDLVRDHPYVDESFAYPIPAVPHENLQVFCTDSLLPYGGASLHDGPFPQ